MTRPFLHEHGDRIKLFILIDLMIILLDRLSLYLYIKRTQ